MSDTPKKIEFIMMNDSAAEFVIANKVAFIESDDNYFKSCDTKIVETYNILLFDNIN